MTESNVNATPTRRRGGIVLASLAGVALFVAACGGTSASPAASSLATSSPDTGLPSASAAASPSGAGAVGGETAAPGDAADDPCALLTADDAATLLGSAATGEAADMAVGLTCRYVPADGTTGFAVATIFTDEAGDTITNAIETFGLAEIPGLGDTAAGTDGTVFVDSGGTVFSIVAADAQFQPVPLDRLQAAAEAAVERLGGSGGGSGASPSASPGGLASPSASPSASP